MSARYAVYLLLGEDSPVDHPVRTAALDRMRAEDFRTAADIAEEFGVGAAHELRRRADGLERVAREGAPAPRRGGEA